MTLVLANPHARGGRLRRLFPAIEQALHTLVPVPRFHAPESLEQALDLLMNENVGTRVVLIGGDGSLNRWLPALLARQLQAGLVPLGSGNDMARALNLDRSNWYQALQLALQGRTRSIDTGVCVWVDAHGDTHRTPFFSSLSCGFDAAVGLRSLGGPRWLRGKPRYVWATLKECWRLRHWTMQVQCDEHTPPSGTKLFTSVYNTPTIGSGMQATPAARIDDGLLNWLHAGPFDRWNTLRILPKFIDGGHLNHPLIETGQCRQMQISSKEALPLAVDGEWLGMARDIQIAVVPASMRMVAPSSAPNIDLTGQT